MPSSATYHRQIKIIIAFTVLSFQFVLACSLSPELETALQEAAESYGLEPALLSALVYQESRYCTDALSPKGAIGLGQLMPGTAQDLGVDPNDPVQNLYGAAAYLRAQWDAFEDWNFALAAYNAGPGAVIKYQGIPPYEETQNYVVSVLSRYTAMVDELPDSSLVEVAAAPTQLTSVLDATEPVASAELPANTELPDSAVVGEEAAPDVVLVKGIEIEKPKPAIMIFVNKRPDLTKIPIMLPTNEDTGLTIFNNE
jgi:Transglycosylase SLT domain